MNGYFRTSNGYDFHNDKIFKWGVYKTPVAPPYSSLPSAATREVTSGTKVVRIVTRLIWLYTEKTS